MDTLHVWSPVINAGFLLAILGGIIHMFIRSRQWTAPAQDVRLRMIEDEQRVLRGNLARFERDTGTWHRDFMEAHESMLRELQAIGRNGAKEHPLEEEMRKIEDRILDVEQVIAALPCAPKCPAPKLDRPTDE